MEALHSSLYVIIKDICFAEIEEDRWFYEGTTYLIPKEKVINVTESRPITCISNLYKLTTKCIAQIIQLEIEGRGLITENKLGKVKSLGAKDQALIKIAINKRYDKKLFTTWLDIKKAFDAVDHECLIKCLESLNLPKWINEFIRKTIESWNIDIKLERKSIIKNT